MKKLIFLIVLINLVLISKAQICGTPGLDGSGNITGSINTYYPISGNVTLNAGSRSIILASVPLDDAYGNNFGIKPISAGDMLLVIQMQDATINATNDVLYGAGNATSGPDNLGGTGFTNLGNTGVFEYIIATNAVPMTGGSLTFRGAGSNKGTVNSYYSALETTTRGKRTFQVVRIPQYSNLILSSSIKTPPFNGGAGGIIAFDVSGIMDFHGFTIDASARGFRGGYGPKDASNGNITSVYMVPFSDKSSVGKGEGIAGTPKYMWDGFNAVTNQTEGLPGGSSGKGAPGNGGGGGNDHNSGGGGGGNGGYGGVGGNGTSSVTAFPNTFPNGGRPGFLTFSSTTPDISRIIMGGGGGGGDANDALDGVKGGVGGGIILINVGRIVGNGTILANGSKGAVGIAGNNPDGAGGGGGGGTVYIKVTNPDPTALLFINARGGNGGNTERDIGFDEHGPGGGGGGGQVFYAMSLGTVNVNVEKGTSGKTNSGNGTPHGASDGTDGNAIPYSLSDLPAYLQGGGSGCYPGLTTNLTEANPATNKYRGSEVIYMITAHNQPGGGNAGGVQIETLLPAGIFYKSATVTYTGDSGGPQVISNIGSLSNPKFGDFNIAPESDVIIELIAEVDCNTVPATYSASAQAAYLDPSRTFSDPNRRITSPQNNFVGSKTTYETVSVLTVPGANFNGSTSNIDDVIVKASLPLANNTITLNGIVDNCVQTIGNEIDPTMITGSLPIGDIGLYKYQWQISGDNVNFTNIGLATTKDYDPLQIASTTYYKRIVTSSACAAPLSSNVIKIKVNVIPKADFELPDFCLNDGTAVFKNISTIEDGTDNQLTYLWDFGDPASGVLNTSTQKDGAHVYSEAKNYNVTLKATSANGCVSQIKSYFFTVNGSIPDAVFVVQNVLRLCSNSTVKFEDRAKVDFGEITKIRWYFDLENHSELFELDNDPESRVAPKTYQHTYDPFNIPSSKQFKVGMVVYSGATCVDSITQMITLNAAPAIEFDAIPPVCVDKPAYQLTQGKERFGVVGQGVYSGDGVTSVGTFTPAMAGVGTHTITYTYKSNAADCIDSDTQDIVVNPSPMAGSENLEILEGGGIILPPIAEETGLTYSWTPSAFLSQANILTPFASPVETTTYILTATDKVTGCSAIGSINVLVHKKPDVPNVFTPNGDNVNDFWVINNLNTYTDCTVNIFNRYGKKIYSSVGYTTPWDGRYKDNEVVSGTYYYIIDPKKGRKPITGSITILR